MVEVEKDFASKGVAGTGLGIAIGAAALSLMNGNLGNLFGGCNNGCGSNAYATKAEAMKDAEISELKTEIKLRDATTFVLEEQNKMRNYVDAKFDAVNAQLCSQAVVNAQVSANLSCLQNTVATLSGLTKTVIPIGNVCPAPMPQYNSWTAPTTGATT